MDNKEVDNKEVDDNKVDDELGRLSNDEVSDIDEDVTRSKRLTIALA